MIFTKSHAANTWGSVAESQKKGFFDFEFITWMAWTWQTAAFFLFIILCFVVMVLWEKKKPGGSPRRGILGLDTTRGDRLFISLLSISPVDAKSFNKSIVSSAWSGPLNPIFSCNS